ncbi:MAG: UDP-N-acetylmuramoyl-tripeptide--D-alanyl-D-alanine ligase, partial [Lachnospiraceae bacterium]|nr:UDP-N-acetylmuramoyl-tripeptide--D-alanyl-D-alanine ligase [Lachnospiraceae bacterium]
PIPGAHQVQNALAAAAVGQVLGLTNEQIAAGVEKVESLGGRSRILETGRYTLIDDCYNANPVSMKAGLALLQQADTRKVAVLGDMFELGTDEKAMHRGVGAAMKEEGICPDVLICIGNLAREIYEGAPEDTEKYLFNDKPAFIEKYGDILKQDDTVLLKASHGMGFSELVELLSE